MFNVIVAEKLEDSVRLSLQFIHLTYGEDKLYESVNNALTDYFIDRGFMNNRNKDIIWNTDHFHLFINKECTLDYHSKSFGPDLYGAYKDWCNERDYRPLTVYFFYKELEKLKLKKVRQNTGYYFIGISC